MSESIPNFEPELGQAIWGCPPSDFQCPEFIEKGLEKLGEAISLATKEAAPTSNVGAEYKTEVFEMRSYYWGDCTCGAECPQHSEECEAKNREEFQDWSDKRWGKCGVVCDSFIEINAEVLELGDTTEFDKANPRPEWTCICGADAAWVEREHCEPTCKTMLPNFKCGSFEVRWYKYLGRGMSMNRKVDRVEFWRMVNRCVDSVLAQQGGRK